MTNDTVALPAGLVAHVLRWDTKLEITFCDDTTIAGRRILRIDRLVFGQLLEKLESYVSRVVEHEDRFALRWVGKEPAVEYRRMQ